MFVFCLFGIYLNILVTFFVIDGSMWEYVNSAGVEPVYLFMSVGKCYPQVQIFRGLYLVFFVCVRNKRVLENYFV